MRTRAAWGKQMAFQYVTVDEAMPRDGLRMVVVGGVPSPWGEAAKGILHIKRIDWVAVRLAHDSEALLKWAGQRSGPVVILNKEPPRSGWAEILLLVERLVPNPALLPKDPAERALAFGLAHEILGEEGLAWTRRLQLVHAALIHGRGFSEPVAKYLAKKYGYRAQASDTFGIRVIELLQMLAVRLKAQRARGSHYYLGNSLTAADVYSATCMALFHPLPSEQCPMDGNTRQIFETLDAPTAKALDPILLEHRDMMYAHHLELPLSL
jgi:glutathione S-transferase